MQRGRLGSFEGEVKASKQRLEDVREFHRKSLENAIAKIAYTKQQLSNKVPENNGTINYPIYNDAKEIFQWMVNEQGESALTYGEIQVRDAEGQEKTYAQYFRPYDFLVSAVQSKKTGILEYMKETGGVLFVK